MPANLENSAIFENSGHRTGKGQFSSQSQRKAMPKNVNYYTIALISHASKVMLKNSPREALTICEPRTSRCTSWI